MSPAGEADRANGPGSPTAAVTNRVLGVALILVGALLAGWLGPRNILTANASSSWPSVQGEVLDTEVFSTGSGGTGPTYRVRYRYRYQVAGKAYENDRNTAGPGSTHSSRSEAENVAGRHPKGSKVVVHYNPEDPADSLLTPGQSGRAWLLVVIGVAALGWGAMILRRSLAGGPGA